MLIKPSKFCYKFYAHRMWREDYGPRCDIDDAFPTEHRFVSLATPATHDEREIHMRRMLAPLAPRDSEVMDEDTLVAGENRRFRPFSEFDVDDIVYHYNPMRQCDVTSDFRLIGIPSARVIKSKHGALGIYCFNCHTITWAISIWDPEYLGDNLMPEDIVIDEAVEQINYDGRVDIDLLNCNQKFIVVDAPPGTGKTHLVSNFIRHPANENKRILFPTFRRSLASYMAHRLGIHSYLLEGILAPNAYAHRKRLTICLDSLTHIPDDDYDIIILDEASLIRLHTASDTMASRHKEVLEIMWRMVRDASTVIIMQYQLVRTTSYHRELIFA